MPGGLNIEQPQRTGEDQYGVCAPVGSAIFLMTSHHLTWSWQTQETPLKIDLSGGCWLNMALHTRGGASSYWLIVVVVVVGAGAVQ